MSHTLLRSVCAASLMAATATTTFATTSENPKDTIVVTATRLPTPILKTGQSVAVLDAATIEDKQTLNVAELLALTPSVTIAQNGGLGTVATARIRGAESDHTIYVLDGVRLADPTQIGGNTNAGLLLAGDIGRIEVVRGPFSTLWGSGAIGGVVSLTSKQTTHPLEGQFSIEGLEDYGSVRLNLGGQLDKLSWRVAAGRTKEADLSALKSGTEIDTFSQNQYRIGLGYEITDAHALSFSALRTRSHTDYDNFGDTGDYGNVLESIYSLGYRFTGANLTHALSVSQADSERHDYSGSHVENVNGKGKVRTFDYTGTANLSDVTRLVFGASHEQSEAYFSSYGSVMDQDVSIDSLFVQGSHDFTDALNVTASLRYADHETFGDHTIGHLSASYLINENLVVRASFGQGFNAPSLYQLYDPTSGNATIRAEEADSGEIGVDYYLPARNARVSLTAFKRETENQIAYVNCYEAPIALCDDRGEWGGYYLNRARTEAEGLELEFEGDLTANTRLRANYSHVISKDAVTDADLPRRPRHLGNIDITHAVTPDFNIGLGLRYAGSTRDSDFSTTRLKPYGVVDLRAAYQIRENLAFYGRVENLGDADYETAGGYSVAGRRLWLGLRADLF
ncbi:MAG: TonB-dependent receptor [Asticcacaulis sp.]